MFSRVVSVAKGMLGRPGSSRSEGDEASSAPKKNNSNNKKNDDNDGVPPNDSKDSMKEIGSASTRKKRKATPRKVTPLTGTSTTPTPATPVPTTARKSTPRSKTPKAQSQNPSPVPSVKDEGERKDQDEEEEDEEGVPVKQSKDEEEKTEGEGKVVKEGDNVDDDEEDDDDDDEAPEVVGKDSAIQTLRERKRREDESRKHQEEAKREQRRQRDQQLKAQAVKKSALEKEKTATRKPSQHVEEPRTPDGELGSASSALQEHPSTGRAESPTESSSAGLRSSKPQQKKRKSDLPDLLPAEILNDTSDKDVDSSDEEEHDDDNDDKSGTDKPANSKNKNSSNKKRKLQLQSLRDAPRGGQQQRPKDIRVGSTSIRVVESNASLEKMAPKASKASRNVKNQWLSQTKHGIGGVGGASLRRAPAKSGGFVRT